MKVSQDRYNYSFKVGRSCEDKFKGVMASRGHDVFKSSKYDDIHKHIDFYVAGYSFDVKGHRHLECIWLELTNVRGDKGWLKGEATYIVFDIVELKSFCFFKRKDLLKYVEENITETTESKEDYNKLYTRAKWGKLDVITKVKFDDIKNLMTQSIAY